LRVEREAFKVALVLQGMEEGQKAKNMEKLHQYKHARELINILLSDIMDAKNDQFVARARDP
jgi:hypothetical protein